MADQNLPSFEGNEAAKVRYFDRLTELAKQESMYARALYEVASRMRRGETLENAVKSIVSDDAHLWAPELYERACAMARKAAR
jgi:hypothetical protein